MKESTQQLLNELTELSKKTNEEWLSSLNERKKEELDFHNKHRDTSKIDETKSTDMYEELYGNKKFYNTVRLSTEYVQNWIKENCNNKICLDYACGNGANAIRMAQAGAELSIGFDISDVSVMNATKSAQNSGVSENTFFLQSDCENTGFSDNSIDICICSGMLHHLDLKFAFPELQRIMKPGGIILCVEALDYNPIIKKYRNKTPGMRTEWEKSHILSYKDIRLARNFFTVKNIKHWHLFSIASVWLPKCITLFNGLDKVFMKVPGIKMMSWMFTFELHKE